MDSSHGLPFSSSSGLNHLLQKRPGTHPESTAACDASSLPSLEAESTGRRNDTVYIGEVCLLPVTS